MQQKADLWIYDIEVAPNCFTITLKQPGGEHLVAYVHETLGVKNMDEVVRMFNCRTRFFVGYNSFHFDDQVMAYIVQNWKRLRLLVYGDQFERRQFTEEINAFAGKIIHGGRDKVEENKTKYHKLFQGIDLMKTNRLFKSLKQVAINLKWPKIQDFPLPVGFDVSEEIFEEFLLYNLNDVDITEALYEVSKPEIQLRSNVGLLYGANLYNEDRSGMANRLLERFYSQATGLHPRTFKDIRTQRGAIELSDCVSHKVGFSTGYLQKFLADVKETVVDSQDKWSAVIRVGKTTYTIALGGIHSVRPAQIFEARPGVRLRDCDVASYYPNLILTLKVAPAHLGQVFLGLYNRIVQERMAARRQMTLVPYKSPEWETLKLKVDALKIVVNAAYGKYGDENYWLYDPLAMYRVTITGQMYLLMLIEQLEEAGIEVVYANTDGITCLVPDELNAQYEDICSRWQTYTALELEFADYDRFIVRDVNNYVARKTNGELKMVGSFDTERWKDLAKAFVHPVVPLAIREYFLNETPVTDTVRQHADPLDFCLSQNIGGQFQAYAQSVEAGKLVSTRLQKTNRYVVGGGREGVALFKQKRDGSGRTRLAPGVVTLVNDYDAQHPPQPDYAWYVEQAQKEVLKFGDASQGDLFG